MSASLLGPEALCEAIACNLLNGYSSSICVIGVELIMSGSPSRRDDLWVLSSTPAFAVRNPAGVGDRLKQPWIGVARSAWHGPNRDGR